MLIRGDEDIAPDTSTPYGSFISIFEHHPYLISNLLGCFIMSICISKKEIIESVSPGLYLCLTTGFCGCLTTFSSWINGAITSQLNPYNFYQVLITVFLEFCITWVFFCLGFAGVKLWDELSGASNSTNETENGNIETNSRTSSKL